MREIQPQEADALAQFLCVVRPDWSPQYAIPAVRNMRLIDSSLERVVRVAINGALLRRNGDFVLRKPDVLAMPGDHWRAHYDRDDSEPARAELCPRCRDWHMPHVDCQAEGWGKRPSRRSGRVSEFARQAREPVLAVNQRRCVHDAPLSLCVECSRKPPADPRPAEETEDA